LTICCPTAEPFANGWPADSAPGRQALLRGNTAERAFGQSDDAPHFRISIAGVQEKTALPRLNGAWHVPYDATPNTHGIAISR